MAHVVIGDVHGQAGKLEVQANDTEGGGMTENLTVYKRKFPHVIQAMQIVDGLVPVECEEELLEAWQVLVDTGYAWTLPGSYGGKARTLIEQGLIAGPTPPAAEPSGQQ
jgi:hypothetical protein